jgi:hypothetical protein
MVRRPSLRAALATAAAAFLWLGAAAPALAQCSSPDAGRWINTKPGGDPEQLEVYFAQCGGDTDGPSQLGLKAFVRQSSGNLHQRRPVEAHYVTDKGVRWLFAKVPTGGYVDNIWMRRVRVNGQVTLKVFIRHESLDSKPSAEDWYYYRKG